MPLTLYRRVKNGPYHIRGTLAGHRVRESTLCYTHSQADAYRARRESQILERHAYGKAATLTLLEAVVAYVQTGRDPRFLDKIITHFGEDQRVADLDNTALQRAAVEIYPDAKPATINRQLIGPVSAVVAMAAENGLAEPRKFRLLKTAGQRTRWLHPAEMAKLLRKADPHLVPILACLIGSGARCSEVLAAEVDNFFPETGEIWLAKTKNGHPRMIRLPRRALDLIFAHGIPAGGKLFRTNTGRPYTIRKNTGGQIKKAFNKARDAADLGPDVTPHVLRHTWATWYYAATHDFGGMLDLGGWNTTSTAERYRKIAPADLGRQLESLGWDFNRLGIDLPPAKTILPDLRVVK